MISKLLTVSMDKLKRCTLIFVCVVLVGCSTADSVLERKGVSTELLQLEHGVHHLINQYRISKKLPPLTPSEIITKQARIHSRAMAKKKVPFGHDGFGKRVKGISRFLPYRMAAENVAYTKGYPDSAQQAVQSWLKNAKHRKNMRGDYRLTGIGVAKDTEGAYYFTQVFWQ